jgi:8-oxo-dGTP pyrophosphatase MutT (NUDIX family)
MGFEDHYRLSAHAVITNDAHEVLLLKATYGNLSWGLPGGALEPGETIHECVARECQEELGGSIEIIHLTGVYYHAAVNSHAFIFRCKLSAGHALTLSAEHSDARYFPVHELSPVQRRRVEECLEFNGVVSSARF